MPSMRGRQFSLYFRGTWQKEPSSQVQVGGVPTPMNLFSNLTSRRTATLEDRLHHLESLIQAIPPAVFAAGDTSLSSLSPPDNLNQPSDPLLQNHLYQTAIPPPSLTMTPLMNPSTHFALAADQVDHDEIARMSLSSSYLYVDDEGFTRWQGETSGLPILDLLIERHHSSPKNEHDSNSPATVVFYSDSTWFPDRTVHHLAHMNPGRLWILVTSFIPPDLMDRYVFVVHPNCRSTHLHPQSLVRCYLSTSHYLMPFLHVPTFLKVGPLTSRICCYSYAISGLRGSSEMGRARLRGLCSRGL